MSTSSFKKPSKLRLSKDEALLSGMKRYRVPMKNESKFMSLYRNRNPCHDQDNEKASSVIANLNPPTKMNPFYNRNLLTTSYGEHMN